MENMEGTKVPTLPLGPELCHLGTALPLYSLVVEAI